MSDALTPGTVIADRYTLHACLTVTAHEGTYRAQASWGDAVVVTIFTPPHADTPTGARVRQTFLRYARLLAQVQHPGVPRVTDLIETPEQVMVVQEDRLHRPLRDVLGGALPPGRTEFLTRQLFGALAAAHAQALLHTDLTPGAIWLDAQDQPVLAGFNLSHRALREAGQTPPPDARYAAPELLAGGSYGNRLNSDNNCSIRADLQSCAAERAGKNGGRERRSQLGAFPV
jgi:serine/threonine protein kinase